VAECDHVAALAELFDKPVGDALVGGAVLAVSAAAGERQRGQRRRK
jgi:hypothetical protein